MQAQNILHPAWQIALNFATNGWKRDGYLFYCYVFILGQKSIAHWAFSEELRELNIFNAYTPYQPEGEITAKIIIPPQQIEKFEFYEIDKIFDDLKNKTIPKPADKKLGPYFQDPAEISNIRQFLKW